MPTHVTHSLLSSAWEVLILFVVPIGGGIPAGVVLAKARGLNWMIMYILYFISDVFLACVFEPLMRLFLHGSTKSERLLRVRQALALSTKKLVARHGLRPSPFSLVMITFGTDPMTGRSVSHAAGHGFFIGWTLTIIGDMMFFAVVMASTLWLNNLLGDGTWAAVIATVLILLAPSLFQKLRDRFRAAP